METQATAEKRIWPGRTDSISFQMRVDAARALSMRVLEGVKALPRRGLEVGGLLVGSSDPRHIEVEDVIAISSEYPDGPVYRVPEEVLRTELANVEGDVVGIYRSRTDGLLAIDGQDEQLLRMLGRGRNFAVMVIRQQKEVPAEVQLGIWRDGAVTWRPEVLRLSDWVRGIIPEVSDESTELVPIPAAAPISAVSHHAEVRPIVDGDPAPSEWRGRRFAAMAALAIVLMFASAGSVWLLRRHAPDDPAQPRAVYGRARKAEPPRDVAPIQPKPNAVSASRPSPPAKTVMSTGQTVVPKPAVAEEKARPQQVVSVPEVKARRTFQPPAAASGSRVAATPELLGEGPRVAAGVSSGVSIARGSGLPVPDPGPSALTTVAPPVQFQPPAIVRQGSAVVIPPDVRRLLRAEVVLQLRASIDKNGRVVGVVPVNYIPDQSAEALVRIYAAAIRDWTFEPARRNGQPVPGDLVLRFRVSPGRM